jgi:spermidine synthase
MQLTAIKSNFNSWGASRTPLTIFLGGINLILIQWVLVREMTMVLLGTELVVLIVTISYFVGLSIGYAWSGRIRREWLAPLAVITLFVHLALPIAFRLLAGWLYGKNIFWMAFIVLPIVVPLTVSSFYSILLPLFIDNGQGRLINLYTIELAGAAVGILLLITVGTLGLEALYTAYALILIILLAALGIKLRWIGILAIMSAGWLLALPDLNARSNAYWFSQVFELENPVTVFSAYSPYQKVDIIDDADGTRYLFLNGLIDYGTTGWNRLNVVLGQIPAQLIQPQSMATVGAGSMALEGLTAQYAGHITTVELDPVELNATRKYFQSVNKTDTLQNWSFVIDDAKHFFANTTDTFDLVTMNVPAPLTGQTATLYSAPFYAGIKARLKPGGVLAASLTRTLKSQNLVTRRIGAGLLANFKHMIVVTPQSVGITFVYASDDLPFTRAQVEAALKDSGETEYTITDENGLREIVGNSDPISLDDLSIALSESSRRVIGLLEPW